VPSIRTSLTIAEGDFSMCLEFCLGVAAEHRAQNLATRNRTRDHLIAAALYSQMLYQLSYSRLDLSTRALTRP
jgi:hypothetical protein